MPYSELTERNYKRICIINWSLSLPMMLIFAYPFYQFSEFYGSNSTLSLLGAITFALPFMITILHGHVTMALGSSHREHYYNWLAKFPLSYGFFFHPVMFRTRFRFSLVFISVVILILNIIIKNSGTSPI